MLLCRRGCISSLRLLVVLRAWCSPLALEVGSVPFLCVVSPKLTPLTQNSLREPRADGGKRGAHLPYRWSSLSSANLYLISPSELLTGRSINKAATSSGGS